MTFPVGAACTLDQARKAGLSLLRANLAKGADICGGRRNSYANVQHPPIKLAAPVGPPVAETVVEHSVEGLSAAPDDVPAVGVAVRVPDTADPLVDPPVDGEPSAPPVTRLPEVCTDGGCVPLT